MQVATAAVLTAAPPKSEKLIAIEQYSALKADLENGKTPTADRAKAERQMLDILPRTGGIGPEAPSSDQAPHEDLTKREALKARMSRYDMSNPADVAAWAVLKQTELKQ
jgi:hypothetical protein